MPHKISVRKAVEGLIKLPFPKQSDLASVCLGFLLKKVFEILKHYHNINVMPVHI